MEVCLMFEVTLGDFYTIWVGFCSSEIRPFPCLSTTVIYYYCHRKKSTGFTSNINDGSVLFKCPCKPWQWARRHNTRTLTLKQLIGIQLSLNVLFTPVLFLLWHVWNVEIPFSFSHPALSSTQLAPIKKPLRLYYNLLNKYLSTVSAKKIILILNLSLNFVKPQCLLTLSIPLSYQQMLYEYKTFKL